ncbi:MAG TPA: Gfo/Idh/MocA family oxidoreductase [bacterium]|nr:Gfo/Idh/MocA family oxidoreductase [bacterium]
MDKVKVGFVGAGGLANAKHYPSLSEIEGVEIVGISDLVAEKMDQTAEKFNIKNKFASYKEMIEKTSPEVVYIVMPPHHLFDIAAHCLTQGLHVFIEKPPGITKEQTRQMASMAEKKGVLTMAGFQRRFSPVLCEAKRMIDERGGVVQCQANFFKHSPGVGSYYSGAIDILTCDAIHAVDVLRWMGGDVKKVVSVVSKLFGDNPNRFCALMEFESGAAGYLSTNWITGRRIYSVEMHGKGILAFADPEEDAKVYKDGNKEAEIIRAETFTGEKDPDSYKNTGFFHENKHFIECIRTKTLPQTNFADAYKTMDLVDRIYHSQM